jgi:arsenite-transporting ATPase
VSGCGNRTERDNRTGPVKRLILYVGKGGVGKTTIAAATAVRAAELGHRTLVPQTTGSVTLAPSNAC